MEERITPYCGPAPAAAELWQSWNGDWRVWLALGLLAVTAQWAANKRAFWLGWGVLALAFLSPLCALTVALFSARALHHLLLLTLAAPLLGAAFPALGRRVPLGGTMLASVAVLAAWHLPGVYAAAWASQGLYWALQLGLVAPAVLFWSRALAQAEASVIAPLSLLAALAGVMGLIGAVLSFAPRVLYPQHGGSALLYGMTPLGDQTLAGLVMWVPGFVPLALGAGLLLRRAWRAEVARAEATRAERAAVLRLGGGA